MEAPVSAALVKDAEPSGRSAPEAEAELEPVTRLLPQPVSALCLLKPESWDQILLAFTELPMCTGMLGLGSAQRGRPPLSSQGCPGRRGRDSWRLRVDFEVLPKFDKGAEEGERPVGRGQPGRLLEREVWAGASGRML